LIGGQFQDDPVLSPLKISPVNFRSHSAIFDAMQQKYCIAQICHECAFRANRPGSKLKWNRRI
jgi:hypothetical protein